MRAQLHGFGDATGEVKVRIAEYDHKLIEPNTVTLMLSEEILQKTVEVCLLDAASGAELAATLRTCPSKVARI